MKFYLIFIIGLMGYLSACQKNETKVPRELAYLEAIQQSTWASQGVTRQMSWETLSSPNDQRKDSLAQKVKWETIILKRSIDELWHRLTETEHRPLSIETVVVPNPLGSSESYLRQEISSLYNKMQTYVKRLEERSESITPPMLQGLGQGQTQQDFYNLYFKGANIAQALLSLVHFQEKISRCEQILAAQKEAEAQRMFREKHGKHQKEFK